jgi:lipopolysaccharide/colanic/teichoic acid biosynthesis glycosyltransferase
MDLVIIKQPRVYPRQWAYQSGKRFFDLSLCILLLPVIIPLVVLCALVIKLDSRGPALYIQDRIGKGGKRFRLYKFRTMQDGPNDEMNRQYMKSYVKGDIDCDENGKEVYKPVHTLKITRVGRILRKTSLDEIPQIINVFLGQMAIVGPRPNVIWEVDEYKPWHHERLEVLPGITGLAQIRGRSCIDFNSLVRYDIEYIEKQSVQLDLKILALTFLTVIRCKGAI